MSSGELNNHNEHLTNVHSRNHRWVDADSILVNPAISPCTFLPPDTLQSVFALVTADHQGFNNGIFYLRVHPSSLDLLTQILDYPLAHPDEDLGWFGEQAAMEKVIHSTEIRLKDQGSLSGIAWIPRDWFNTFEFEHSYEDQPGHFIVHFASLAETRIQHNQVRGRFSWTIRSMQMQSPSSGVSLQQTIRYTYSFVHMRADLSLSRGTHTASSLQNAVTIPTGQPIASTSSLSARLHRSNMQLLTTHKHYQACLPRRTTA